MKNEHHRKAENKWNKLYRYNIYILFINKRIFYICIYYLIVINIIAHILFNCYYLLYIDLSYVLILTLHSSTISYLISIPLLIPSCIYMDQLVFDYVHVVVHSIHYDVHYDDHMVENLLLYLVLLLVKIHYLKNISTKCIPCPLLGPTFKRGAPFCIFPNYT